MKIPAVVLLFASFACAACNQDPKSTASPATEAEPRVEAEPLPPAPGSIPGATPNPVAGHRAQLLARIETLNNRDCDTLVLLFQIIPRDEILNPLSEPKKELLRYVKRIASTEELDAVERAIKELSRPSAAEPGAIHRANQERRR